MNTVKFRPVGRPKGEVVRVKISQRKSRIYARYDNKDNFRPAPELSLAGAHKQMLRRGYVRVNN